MTPESTSNARTDTPSRPAPSRRQLFALSAVLAATVLTAGVAIAGLTRTPSAPPASTPTVDQIVNQTVDSVRRRGEWSRATDARRLGDARSRSGRSSPSSPCSPGRVSSRPGAPAQGPAAVVVKGKNGKRQLVLLPGASTATAHATTRTSPGSGRMIAAVSAGVPVAWLIARAAGLVAFGLLTLVRLARPRDVDEAAVARGGRRRCSAGIRR